MRVGFTSIDVEADRILVWPSIADLAACSRLHGGAWNARRKGWAFAATSENAAVLKRSFRLVRTTPGFETLLAPEAAAEVEPDSAGAGSAAAQAREQELAAPAAAVIPEPDIAVPEGLLTRPWSHQRAAFRFCLDKFATGMRGILLALGMGLGKTLVLWMLILHLRARRVMVIAPLRVVQVWIGECERHVGVPVVIVALDEAAGSVARKMELAARKMRLAETMGVPFVCVVNYDSVWREPFASWAEKIYWDVIAADEAHRAKAPGGKASLCLKRLRKVAAYRFALTGTPMPHGPLDVFAIFRFLDVSIFGPAFSPFRAKHAVMGGYQNKQVTGYQKLDELEAQMSRITFRVGSEVLDLPPATHVTYYCDLSREARRVYKDLDKDFVAEYLHGVITASNALVKLTRLQQVANGVVKDDHGIEHRIDHSKQKLLADTLEDIGNDEPVVVFCRFHLDMDAVHEACREHGYTSLELSGRRDELKQWQDGAAQVLAVQISAGGVGVNLTRARFCIYYSLSFSLGDYEQSEKRVHRPGQTRPVEYIHLVARNTVDVKIMRALEKRAEIVASILAEIRQ